jgi:hypothetical protein
VLEEISDENVLNKQAWKVHSSRLVIGTATRFLYSHRRTGSVKIITTLPKRIASTIGTPQMWKSRRSMTTIVGAAACSR